MSTNQPFKQTIKTIEELREVMGEPSKLAKNKVIRHLDPHCLEFIAKSPICFLSTADEQGFCDVSPRGDQPGFARVLNEKYLLIPERPGNKRVDSMRNILTNPRIGLIFLIPGLEETLRVNGKATLVRDEELLQQMMVRGQAPKLAIAVEVEECFIHCAKALKRSQLWQSETWLVSEERPSASKMLHAHANLQDTSLEEVEQLLDESYTKRLY